MALSFIKMTAIGNLGNAPEAFNLPSGDLTASFSIASTERWTDKATGDKKEKTTWLNVKAFGKLAELVLDKLHKGDKVYLEGSFTTYKTNKDGVEIERYEMRLDDFTAMSQGQSQAQQGNQNHGNQNQGYNQNQGQAHNGQRGGYNQNQQGGYNQNQQGGYNQNQQGGYNQNQQGGYNQNQQGGYSRGNRPQGGFNNQ